MALYRYHDPFVSPFFGNVLPVRRIVRRPVPTWHNVWDTFMNDFEDFPIERLREPELDMPVMPSLTATYGDDGIVLNGSFAAVKPKDVHIKVSEGVLTVSAKTSEEEESNESDEKKSKKRRVMEYCQRFELPEGVAPEDVKAKLDNDMKLTITIPKTEPPKPLVHDVPLELPSPPKDKEAAPEQDQDADMPAAE